MKPTHLVLLLGLGIAGCQADPATTVPGATDATAPITTTAADLPSPPEATSASHDALDSATPLAVGAQAPGFTAKAWLAGKPQSFTLAKALESGPVVLYFFPAAFTPGCNIEARAFSEAIDRFRASGATVIGITAGNADQLQAFSSDNSTCSGRFAVAADPGAEVARSYGALLASRPEWSSRTSFVIARDGRIAAVHSDPDPSRHVERMLEGVAALQP